MGNFAGLQLCETCEKTMIDASVLGLIFEETIKHNSELNFGQAIEALKDGKKVARQGWNGKGMFIYLVRGQEVAKCNLRNEARLHLEVKDHHHDEITINSHIDMKAADGSIVVGWLASQTDMLAEDWEVVE